MRKECEWKRNERNGRNDIKHHHYHPISAYNRIKEIKRSHCDLSKKIHPKQSSIPKNTPKLIPNLVLKVQNKSRSHT
ncbi:hypothetical protein Syun_017091 [Stephania yunnanensis]|uniref:Uncharacterized protein n=1 Tax=Stephania yunnanensis TaxID=152371 RepID=A0AAP0J6A7_9MAGN